MLKGNFNIIITGVGGQGLITLVAIFNEAAFSESYDVKSSELHGLSQRGGSVETHVRFGKKVYSPLISDGEADLIIGLELLEGLRAVRHAGPKTKFLVNEYSFPFPGSLKKEEILDNLKKIVKNKLFAPNLVVNILGDFVRGFSNFWTSYSFLVETGRIKTGAWNFLMNTPEKKFRTKDAENMYEKDEGFKLAFDELVKDAIKIDIVEKHNPNLYED